jgi:hypothetical protein
LFSMYAFWTYFTTLWFWWAWFSIQLSLINYKIFMKKEKLLTYWVSSEYFYWQCVVFGSH